MERSQSCSNFNASDVNYNIPINALPLSPRPAIDLHQVHVHQHSGSSDCINVMSILGTVSASNSSRSGQKPLLRQTSNTTNVNVHELHNDADYHADLEEDAAELEHSPGSQRDFHQGHSLVSMHPYQKRFQRHKPQSESSLASSSKLRFVQETSFDPPTGMDMSPASLQRHRCGFLMRDNSVHSDSSRYSSVDSLLEARKPDPEAILINLGFGPIGSEDILSRIPKRFLKPSQVRGIDTEAFVKRLQLASNLADHSVLGYRGLTGNPDIPPSSIVAKIMERFEVNERKKSMGSLEQAI